MVRYAIYLVALLVVSKNLWAAPEFSFAGEGYAIGAFRSILDAPLNPDNTVRNEGRYEAALDLRPEFQFRPTDNVGLLARPRIRPRWKSIPAPRSRTDRSLTDLQFYFDEASVRWDIAPDLRLVAGVHYYSWGPGELLSPSNPLFHFQWDSRSIIFRQRGKVLVRASWSLGQAASLSAFVEPIADDEIAWLPSARHTPRALLRGEVLLSEGTASLGAVAGRMERGAYFFGESGSAYLDDAISGYFDARHTFGRIADVPVMVGDDVVSVAPGDVNEGALQTLALIGLRYEGFFDSRVEYIYNSYGYRPREFAGIVRAASLLPAAVAATARPGLELPRQHYLFLSLRTDKLGQGDELQLALRYLHSLADHSGAFFGAAEWAFADRWTWIVEPGISHGAADGEFRQAAAWEIQSELRMAF